MRGKLWRSPSATGTMLGQSRGAGDEDVSSDKDREPPPGSSDEDDEEEETVVATVHLAGEMMVAAAMLKRHKDRHEAWKAVEIAKRDRNDARVKQRRAGDEDVSFNEDREPPPSSFDEDDEEEEKAATTIRLEGEMTEGCSSSTSGAPSGLSVANGATQGPAEVHRGGVGARDRMPHLLERPSWGPRP